MSTKIVNVSAGHGSWTAFGKREIALAMYRKGRSFLAAAVLLRRHGGDAAAVLHLVCQGAEITLKSMLLLKSYDTYAPQLKTKLSHNLCRIVSEVLKAYNLDPLRPAVHSELVQLNELYRNHFLRYGTGYDVLVDSRTIECRLVQRALGAAVRLADRHVRQIIRAQVAGGSVSS